MSIIVASDIRFGCAKKGSERLSRQVEAILKARPVCTPATTHADDSERIPGLRVEN